MASRRLKVVAVVGFCAACTFLGLILIAIHETSPEAKPARTLNEGAVKFVAAALIDDLAAREDGRDSVVAQIKAGDFVAWTKIDATVTARQYDDAFDANEISAENRFKGKVLLVSGTIDSIETDALDSGIVMLRAANPVGVRAELSSDAMAEAASFSKGQKISLVCDGGIRMVGIPNLDNCRPYRDYLNQLSPSIQSRVEDFLDGKAALHAQAAQIVVIIYLAGTRLPPNSGCLLGGHDDDCLKEVSTAFKDSTQLQALETQTQTMLSGLQVAK